MLIEKRIKRIQINYELLNGLYKLGRFEDEVAVTSNINDTEKFFCIQPEQSSIPSPSSEAECKRTKRQLGKGRNDTDLEWATSELRKQALDLNRSYRNNRDLPGSTRRDIILYYYRTLSLSYEVSDYFLEVTKEMSNFLVTNTIDVTNDIEKYLKQFTTLFIINSSERRELVKHILIVALCGINELYRKHKYKEGLVRLKILNQLISNLPEGQGRWFGLKGLSSFVEGKFYIALGQSDAAEWEFRHSVELYSESVWQKERDFSPYRERAGRMEEDFHKGLINREEYEKKMGEFSSMQRAHELSRVVALRRSGLASSFGYAFQALVMGKVRDAIHLSALARGIVSSHTGKLHRSYVDLIYYSAKRAENSSNREVLLNIKKNLRRCYRVFKDLVPTSHYKNKALFQLSLVHHYLARSYYTASLKARSDPATTIDYFRRSKRHWLQAERCLRFTIVDKKLDTNKRLRAESMAILGHVLCNLALLAIDLGEDGMGMIEMAETTLNEAWIEAEQHPHIQCEVGLAQAAAGKAKADYLDRSIRIGNKLGDLTRINLPDTRSRNRALYEESLNAARSVLHKVLFLNNNYSGRVQATAYLRLTEIALMENNTRMQARGYYEKYLEISSQVEHDFCRQWAFTLKERLRDLDRHFTFTIEPGGLNTDKTKLEEKLAEFYVEYTINAAAMEIEEDLTRKKNSRGSVSAYISRAFSKNFRIVPSTARTWIGKYDMIDRLIQICPAAAALPQFARQSNKGKKE